MTEHAPNQVMTKTVGTNHSLSITDAVRENTITSQGHTANLIPADVPAPIDGMHPTPHPTTTDAHNTHPLTDALDNTLLGHPMLAQPQPIHNMTLFMPGPLSWLLYRPKLV